MTAAISRRKERQAIDLERQPWGLLFWPPSSPFGEIVAPSAVPEPVHFASGQRQGLPSKGKRSD